MSVQPTEVDVELELPAPSRPEQQFEVETCSISRWRGYVTSSFIALLDDGTAVAESPEFRCRGRAEPPDEGAVRDAYDKLRVELRLLGWEETETRSHSWYANRFTRPTAVPVDTAPKEDAAIEASTLHVLEAPPAVEPEPRRLREAVAPPIPQRAEPHIEREPQRVEATPVRPAAAQRAIETPQRSRMLTIISVLGIIGALVMGAYLAFGQGGRHTTLRYVTTPVSAAKPTPVVATVTPAPKPSAAKVRVSITAGDRASWLEVRRGSATGTVLFTGELAAGQSLHLNGKRLWARFGAARNLTIRANGRLVTFVGTFEHVFTAATK